MHLILFGEKSVLLFWTIEKYSGIDVVQLGLNKFEIGSVALRPHLYFKDTSTRELGGERILTPEKIFKLFIFTILMIAHCSEFT